nr:dipeptidase 1 [Pelodiscus sinensis]|eukprot:XP_025035416.1 dipeptidase 1 [Pelodiscus sinensis]
MSRAPGSSDVGMFRGTLDLPPQHTNASSACPGPWLTAALAGIEDAFRAKKVASLIGVEGGHSIDSSLGALRMFYRLGVRYMTLTHSCNTPWRTYLSDWPGPGAACAQHLSLTHPQRVVREMNRLGMLVDLAHVSVQTMEDALEVSKAPVIFSHSSAYELCRSRRAGWRKGEFSRAEEGLAPLLQGSTWASQLPVSTYPKIPIRRSISQPRSREGTQVRLCPQNQTGGLVMVNFYNLYVSCKKEAANLSQVADHLDHIKKVAGAAAVGFGGDYDGVTTVPQGLEDVSKYPDLVAELLRRKWTEAEVKDALAGNLLRVFRKVEEIRDSLSREAPDACQLGWPEWA